MQLFGHRFLRSNWKAGDPLRLICNARQMRTLANIPKYIKGVYCRVIKPTDCEGKNWTIMVDGTSDITPPPFTFPPWDESGRDQFKVVEGYEEQKVIVEASETWDTMVSNGGDVQWDDDPGPIVEGQLSEPLSVPHGTESALFAEYTAAPSPTVVVNLLLPDEDGVYTPGGDFAERICTITTDTRGRIITLVQNWVGQFITTIDPAQPKLIGVQMLGGVWQELDKATDETTIYTPETAEAATIAWDVDSDTSHHQTYSRPYEGGGVIWARLDKTATPDPVLSFVVLGVGVDPTWADDIQWLKIATVTLTLVDPDDAESDVESVEILQHHQGGIHTEIGNAPSDGACASMTHDPATGSITPPSASAVVDFATINHETNSAILDANTTTNTIAVKDGYSGIYSLKLYVNIEQSTSTPVEVQFTVRKAASDTECNWRVVNNDIDLSTSSTIDLFVDASEGDVAFDVYCYALTNATVNWIRFDMALVQLCSSAT